MFSLAGTPCYFKVSQKLLKIGKLLVTFYGARFSFVFKLQGDTYFIYIYISRLICISFFFNGKPSRMWSKKMRLFCFQTINYHSHKCGKHRMFQYYDISDLIAELVMNTELKDVAIVFSYL